MPAGIRPAAALLALLTALVIAAPCAAHAAHAAPPQWSPPVAISASGAIADGWLDRTGSFRTTGQAGGGDQLREVDPEGGVGGVPFTDPDPVAVGLSDGSTLAVQGVDPVRLTVLDRDGRRRHSFGVRGRLPVLFGFDIPAVAALSGGGAVLCTDLAADNGEEVAVIGRGGRSIRVMHVHATAGQSAVQAPTGGCFGVAARPGSRRAAVLLENRDAFRGSGAVGAQLLITRVRPTGLSRPRPVVPAGERFTINAGQPQLTETSAGWLAVSWLQTLSGDTGVGQLRSAQRLRWIAPGGGLGRVIDFSHPAAGIPPAVLLAATGPRAATALINPEERNRRILSVALSAGGAVGPRETLFAGSRITLPQIASDQRTVAASWLANGSVFAAVRRGGRWSAPALIRGCAGFGGAAVCPAAPGVAVGPRRPRGGLVLADRPQPVTRRRGGQPVRRVALNPARAEHLLGDRVALSMQPLPLFRSPGGDGVGTAAARAGPARASWSRAGRATADQASVAQAGAPSLEPRASDSPLVAPSLLASVM